MSILKSMIRRQVMGVAALGLAIGTGAFDELRAADFPSETVRIVVPFSAGSGTDLMTRRVADDLGHRLKSNFVVENVAGASGQIAATQVARAKPNGYTLFFTTNTTHSANPSLFKKLSYDPVKDFEPITLISETPFLLVVRADHPAKTAKDLIAMLKANPKNATYGFGNSTGQIAGAALATATGIDMVPVPYKGTPAAASDVIGDRLSFMFIDTPAAQTYLKSGRLRALAISSAKRSSIMPDMPTLLEATGLPGLDIVAWSGAFAPAGTPTEIIMKLNKAIRAATETPEYTGWRSKLASEVVTMEPAEFASYVKASIDSWGKMIRAAGIAPQ